MALLTGAEVDVREYRDAEAGELARQPWKVDGDLGCLHVAENGTEIPLPGGNVYILGGPPEGFMPLGQGSNGEPRPSGASSGCPTAPTSTTPT